jgi:hypothetical protein
MHVMEGSVIYLNLRMFMRVVARRVPPFHARTEKRNEIDATPERSYDDRNPAGRRVKYRIIWSSYLL